MAKGPYEFSCTSKTLPKWVCILLIPGAPRTTAAKVGGAFSLQTLRTRGGHPWRPGPLSGCFRPS